MDLITLLKDALMQVQRQENYFKRGQPLSMEKALGKRIPAEKPVTPEKTMTSWLNSGMEK